MESFTAGSAESSRDENEDPDSLLELDMGSTAPIAYRKLLSGASHFRNA